jgi:hypothetical protein
MRACHDATMQNEAEDGARNCRDRQQQFSASERFQPVYLLSGVDLSSFCIQQLENLKDLFTVLGLKTSYILVGAHQNRVTAEVRLGQEPAL